MPAQKYHVERDHEMKSVGGWRKRGVVETISPAICCGSSPNRPLWSPIVLPGLPYLCISGLGQTSTVIPIREVFGVIVAKAIFGCTATRQ